MSFPPSLEPVGIGVKVELDAVLSGIAAAGCLGGVAGDVAASVCWGETTLTPDEFDFGRSATSTHIRMATTVPNPIHTSFPRLFG